MDHVCSWEVGAHIGKQRRIGLLHVDARGDVLDVVGRVEAVRERLVLAPKPTLLRGRLGITARASEEDLERQVVGVARVLRE